MNANIRMENPLKLWKYKLKFLWRFFLSIQFTCLVVTLATAIPLNWATDFSSEEGVALFVKHMAIAYSVLGVGGAALYQETLKSHEYYFYYNGACSKLDLWVFSFILTSLIAYLVYKILMIWI